MHVRLRVRMLGMLRLLVLVLVLLLVWVWRRLALIRIAAAVLLIGIHVGTVVEAAVPAVCALRCGFVVYAVGGVLGLSGRGVILEVRLHGGASKRQAGRASSRIESFCAQAVRHG